MKMKWNKAAAKRGGGGGGGCRLVLGGFAGGSVRSGGGYKKKRCRERIKIGSSLGQTASQTSKLFMPSPPPRHQHTHTQSVPPHTDTGTLIHRQGKRQQRTVRLKLKLSSRPKRQMRKDIVVVVVVIIIVCVVLGRTQCFLFSSFSLPPPGPRTSSFSTTRYYDEYEGRRLHWVSSFLFSGCPCPLRSVLSASTLTPRKTLPHT